MTRDVGMQELARIVEALLFLSPEPVAVERLADACEVSEGEVVEALARLREHYAEGFRGVVLREVGGGFALATDPVAERAARRLLAKPRTPPLTQAQAECLAIIAYLQPVSRPEVARIRGVASESAVGTLLERPSCSASAASRHCPTPPTSTRAPRTRASCASGSRGRGSSGPRPLPDTSATLGRGCRAAPGRCSSWSPPSGARRTCSSRSPWTTEWSPG